MNNYFRQTIKILFLVLISKTSLFAEKTWTKHSNFESISDIEVTSTKILIAAKGGACMIDKASGAKTFYLPGNDSTNLPSFSIERFFIDPATSDSWIGTYDNGLAKKASNSNAWVHIPFPKQYTMLYEMKMSADGTVWCATSKGLYKYKNNAFTAMFETTTSGSANVIWDLEILPSGNILVMGDKLLSYNPTANTNTILPSKAVNYISGEVVNFGTNNLAVISNGTSGEIFINNLLDKQFSIPNGISNFKMIDNKMMGVVKEFVNSKYEYSIQEVSAAGVLTKTSFGQNIKFNTLSAIAMSGTDLLIGTDDAYTNINTVSSTGAVLNTNSMKHSEVNGTIGNVGNDMILNKNASTMDLMDLKTMTLSNQWNMQDSMISSVTSNVLVDNNELYAVCLQKNGSTNNLMKRTATGTQWTAVHAQGFKLFNGSSFINYKVAKGGGKTYIVGVTELFVLTGTTMQKYDYISNPELGGVPYYANATFDSVSNSLIILGTNSVFKFTNGTFTKFNKANTPTFPTGYVTNISIPVGNQNGKIYFTTNGSEYMKYDNGVFTTLTIPQGQTKYTAEQILEANGNMYFVTSDTGKQKEMQIQIISGTSTKMISFNKYAVNSSIAKIGTDDKIYLIGKGVDVYNPSAKADTVAKIDTVVKASINLSNTSQVITIYPNPSSNGVFNVNVSNDEIVGDITATNLQGKIIKVSSASTIDLGAYSNGFYILNFSTNSNQNISKRVLKQ
jgi:hypothetical protein